MYAQDSIELLRQSGIDFKAHLERGIDVRRFGELVMVSVTAAPPQRKASRPRARAPGERGCLVR
jgi:hypothetical protein